MKKTLIALAVLGFTGVAMAQSSVTLYGVADAGASHTESYGPAADTTTNIGPAITNGMLNGATINGVNIGTVGTKTKFNGMSSSGLMNNGNSRLGVRGVEDMGGGLKAGFNFEDGLSLNDGSTGYSSTTKAFWGRQANVWLGGPWGQFVMGRAYNPSYDTLAAWELTGQANYSVVGNTYQYTGEGPRSSSQFKYVSPDFAGFKAELAYVARDNNLDPTGQPRNNWDLGLTYENGPVAAGISANKMSGNKTNYEIGGKYTFSNVGNGQLSLAASYNRINLLGYDTSGAAPVEFGELRRQGFSLGGSYVTGPFTVTLDLTRDTKFDADVFGAPEVRLKKRTNAVLEGKYALSKRTFVYAAYLRLDDTNNYGIGLRHNF